MTAPCRALALRLKRGEELRVRLVNELPEPTTIHWHGVRLPNSMDGVPHLTQAPVAPGASFDYRFRAPDAGTFCYYAPGQEDRGLYGALIVEEGQPVGVDREIVLALGAPGEPSGAAGSLLVNGSVRPNIPVKAGERLRLRLINATRARGLAVRVDGHSMWVMAIDGEPAEPFLARERVALDPAAGSICSSMRCASPAQAVPCWQVFARSNRSRSSSMRPPAMRAPRGDRIRCRCRQIHCRPAST